MEIFITVLGIIVVLLLILLITNLKVSVYFNTLENETILVIKVYIYSFIRVVKITKRLKSEKKKFSEKIEFIINYLFKSKADPIEYAQKEIKKSKSAPKFVKNIDIQKMFIEQLELNARLDLGSAAISAIATGAANGIISMVLSKYENNIKGPVEYNIIPGYTNDGVKVKAFVKVRMKVLDILKMLLKK